jgi:hypothetical protein
MAIRLRMEINCSGTFATLTDRRIGFIKAVLDQMNASLESIMRRPSISNSLTNTRSNRTEPRDGN